MKHYSVSTKKGAASIYIVIFTTTLLGIIALSFVRIMLAESLRTTNYSLSQSAYNSALAGVEDAKIVLLRYQNCVNKGNFVTGSSTSADCASYEKLFDTSAAAFKAAKNCNIVGKLLHGRSDNDPETLIQTDQGTDTGTIDQAYTCVKINAYTEDFLAVLGSGASSKLVPLRSENSSTQNRINRIQVMWFSGDNYSAVSTNNALDTARYDGFWTSDGKATHKISPSYTTNIGVYNTTNSTNNIFTEKSAVPPPLQITMVQTAPTFKISDFYSRSGNRTNRGTVLLRPTNETSVKTARGIHGASSDGKTQPNTSNILPENVMASSANKSYNTPIDVYCDLTKPGGTSQVSSDYACSADFYLPKPIGALERNLQTSFLAINLPYGGPQTDIAVKMYECIDNTKAISATIDGNINCKVIDFANVQPMVDSTGRANDLFRRVESRIELADTNYPIANYALSMVDPNNNIGIQKDFFVTNDCGYTSSKYSNGDVIYVNGASDSSVGTSYPITGRTYRSCPNSGKAVTGAGYSGNGNGE